MTSPFTATPTVNSTPVQEYADRLARVREEMRRRSMAALVVTDPSNIYYLSGYNAWSFYTPQCLVVPAEGDPVLFAREMDAIGADFTTFLPMDLVEGYPEPLVHRPDVHPFDWISARALERGLVPSSEPALVGFEGDSHFFSARGYLALAKGLPNVTLEDSRELVNWARLVKSPYELEQMRIAGSIAQHAMEVALDAIEPGRRQCDVVSQIMTAQTCGTEEHGGDYPAIFPLLPTGDGAGTPHLTWTDTKFVAGEATTIEIAGAYHRYHAPIARTIMLGDPPERLATMAAVVRDGMAAVLAAMRPGQEPDALQRVWEGVIGPHGFSKPSRIGYSIGVGYPPDWGERTVSLRSGERTALAPGMCFHVILGMWMNGWGYELSEPVVVTDGGVDKLTDLTQDLTIRKERTS